MSSVSSRFYDGGEVVERGSVAAASIGVRGQAPARTLRDALCEIDALRSINGHLVQQIAELARREAQAQQQADRDGLTGLYNRRKMMDLLETSVSDAQEQNNRVGVLFIDLDGFKGVNDTHGHAAGDKLLTTVSSRIAARARTGDFVCRYGGDEFVVILPRVADAMAMLQVADAIRNRVALPYRVDGIELHLTAAMGGAIYPDQASSAVELLKIADESMYRMKINLAGPMPLMHRIPAPTRRRDDKMKRRSFS